MDHRSIDTGAIHAQEAAIHPMFESTGILAVLNKKEQGHSGADASEWPSCM
jgi:hypothetical protein